MLHKIEQGSLKPSLELAHKLEKLLSLKLTDYMDAEYEVTKTEKTGALTIGDLIKIKKK